MAENKTKATTESVEKFLKTITDKTKQEDCLAIIDMMKSVTKLQPKMWGAAMVGFGELHYKYESGREGDTFLIGFSPRKANIAIYGMGSVGESTDLLKKLGKHKTDGGCVHINKLEDVNVTVLKEIFKTAFAERNKHIQ